MMKRFQLMLCIVCSLFLACSSQTPNIKTQPEVQVKTQPDVPKQKEPEAQNVPGKPPQPIAQTEEAETGKTSLEKLEAFMDKIAPEVVQDVDVTDVPDIVPQQQGFDLSAQISPLTEAQPPASFQVQVTPADTEQARLRREMDSTQGVKLNFDNASVYDVTKVVSEITGKSFIIDREVEDDQYRVTIFSEELLLPDQVFELYKSALELNGLTVTQVGDFYKITSNTDAQKHYLPLDSGFEPTDEDRLITRIVKLRHVSAGEVKKALSTLVGDGKDIVEYPDENGNTLIIANTAANVRKILSIIREIDISRYIGQYFEIFPIRHAELNDLVNDLTQILSLQEDIVEAPSEIAPTQTPGTEEQPAQQAQSQQEETVSLVSPGTRTRLHPISRLNALAVSTNNAEVISLVRKWIDILDQPSVAQSAVGLDDSPYHIYPVRYAKAGELTNLLVQVYDERSQSAEQEEQEGQEEQEEQEEQEGQEDVPAVTPLLGTQDASAPVFIPDEKTNSIIIKATNQQYADILTLLETLDQRPLQVLIDVIIAEITLADNETLGIRSMLFGQDQVSLAGETNTIETTSEIVFEGVTTGEGFLYTINAPGRFLAELQALATENKLKVLSDPHVLVRNNEDAVINVGERIPIETTTVSGDDRTTSVRYEDTGIILTVTPQINIDGDVVMEIKQQINDVGEKQYGGTNAASFTTREATTIVVTQDGYPLVIGGLIQDRDEVIEKGVPLLKDIPWIGRLFRDTKKENRRTDLFILVTPHVIRTPGQGWNVTNNVLQDSIKDLEKLFNREETDSDKIKQFLRNRFRINEE